MIEFVLYDKTNAFLQRLVPTSSHTELLWNQASFAELTFDSDDRARTNLEHGARIGVMWDGVEYARGPWVAKEADEPDGSLIVTVEDDFRLFSLLLAWAKPAAAITAQSDVMKQYTGVTETVVKAVCGDLNSRLSLGWTIPTTTGLGSAQRVEARFDPLSDILTPLVNADRLTWSLRGGTVDVVEGDLFPRVLTQDSGVLGNVKWREEAPTVTRPIIGGSGEGASRILRQYIDSARETEWGFKAESFRDSSLADGVTDLTPDSVLELAEKAGKVSVQSELIESDWFRFGAYKVGDRVHINTGPIDQEEVIRSVVIDDTPDQGTVVVPSIGDLASTVDEKLGRQVSALARGVRAQGRR